MSQAGQFLSSVIPPTGFVEFLTGNTGGLVPPTAGNINVVGDGTTVTVAGNPGTSTLTISVTGAVADSFPADSGTATPSGGVLNIFSGGQGRATPDCVTIASGNTVRVDLRNVITLGDLSAVPANTPSITATTGDIKVTAGNLTLPNTTSTSGQVVIGGNKFVHNFGPLNTFVGSNAGNTTYTGLGFNTGVGFQALTALTTGQENTAIGRQSQTSMTTGGGNTSLGTSSLANLKTGINNVSIGTNNAMNYTGAESNNILIGRNVLGTAGDSNMLYIGAGTGTGANQINVANISGIYNQSVGATNAVVYIDSTGVLGTTGGGAIPVANGGTGRTTLTNHSVLVGAGTSAITQLAVGATGTVLVGSTGADPSFSATPTVTSITFGAGTALSTYQEGTWTPTLDGAVSGTSTYVTQIGTYVKIGKMVTVWANMQLSAATGTGNATFGGLPFTSTSTTSYVAAGSVTIDATGWSWPAGTTYLVPVLAANATTGTITACGTAHASGSLQMTNAGIVMRITLTYNTA